MNETMFEVIYLISYVKVYSFRMDIYIKEHSIFLGINDRYVGNVKSSNNTNKIHNHLIHCFSLPSWLYYSLLLFENWTHAA